MTVQVQSSRRPMRSGNMNIIKNELDNGNCHVGMKEMGLQQSYEICSWLGS